jgi:hypothetical protein
MSSRAPWRSERSSGLLDDALNLELRLGGARKGSSQMEQGNLFRLSSLEWRLDQRKGSASEHAIDQKEIAETVGVKSLNSPSLYDAAHSNLLPGCDHICAPGKNCTQEPLPSREFDSAPHYYGWLFQCGTEFATGAGAI